MKIDDSYAGRHLSQLEASFAESTSNKSNDPVKMYLKEIGRVDLLTTDEERQVAQAADAGDKEAIDLLITANLRLVVSIAKNILVVVCNFRLNSRRKYWFDASS